MREKVCVPIRKKTTNSVLFKNIFQKDIYAFTQLQNKIFSTIFRNIFIYFSKKITHEFHGTFLSAASVHFWVNVRAL